MLVAGVCRGVTNRIGAASRLALYSATVPGKYAAAVLGRNAVNNVQQVACRFVGIEQALAGRSLCVRP